MTTSTLQQAKAIGDKIAADAVALHLQRPDVPALQVLDFVLEGQQGATVHFDSLWSELGSPFQLLVTRAFDDRLPADVRAALLAPNSQQLLADTGLGDFMELWPSRCSAYFMERYRLREFPPARP